MRGKTQEKGLPPASGPLSSSPCDRAGLARFASLAILCNFFGGSFERLVTVHIFWVCIERACYIGGLFYILNYFLLQVVDIVRTNVRAILQRVWRASEVDNLRLCRVFSRVFNRLLWSHGQGLWNCFSNLGYVYLT